MDQAFWSAQHRWPFDTAEHVFLARAYDQIGRARFPDTWTGREAVTLPPREERRIPAILPTVVGNWPPEHEREQLALDAFAGKPPQQIVSVFRPGSPAEIVLAEKLTNEEKKRRLEALIRRDAVSRLMIERAATDGLRFSYVPADGSAKHRLCPGTWWRTTLIKAWPRFWACRIDPSNPFFPIVSGSAWLFVTRKSLQATLKQLGLERVEPSTKSRAGRKKGSAFASLDSPLLNKMRKLLSNGTAVSASSAALTVVTQAVARAKGLKRPLPPNLRSTPESIAKRLARALRTAR